MATASLSFPYRLTILILISCWISQCACRKPVDPEVSYSHVREEAQRGDLDAALKDVARAFQFYSEKKKDFEWAWRFRVLNAHILVMRGASAEALHLLQASLPASLATSETAVRQRLVSGLADESLQQFDAAAKELGEAERLSRAYQPALLASVEQARGQLEIDRHRYSEAEADLQAALSSSREQKQPFLEVTVLGTLGNVAMQQEHFDAAIDWYEEALKLAKSIGMQSSVAKALGNMGWSSFELGDFEGALTLYKQGAEDSRQSGLVADRIYWLSRVAKTEYLLRDYATAEENLLELLKLARGQDDKRILTECLNDLTLVTLDTGRLESAQNYNQQAIAIERSGLDMSGIPNTKMLTARISEAQREFVEAERLFQEIITDSKNDQSLRWQAQAHLARVYAEENLPAKAEQEFTHSLETIQTDRSSIQEEEHRLSFLSSSIAFYGDYIDFLISRHRIDDALSVAERSRAGTLEEGLRDSTGRPDHSRKSSEPKALAVRLHAALLFYWLGEKHSYLWVISPSGTDCITLPPAPSIDSIVKSYRGALLEARDPLENVNPDGQKLYELLVKPAASKIPKGSRVVVLPDGSLYGLNFETLIVPTPKPHYWIDDVTLTTASSLTLLNFAASRPAPKGKSLFLVGDTVSPNADFPALPQAAAEMQDIERFFPAQRREVLSGGQATPAAYLSSKPEQFTYLHFVTHGTASRARPLESAVILSKEKGEDTFKLYARDIVKRHLSAYLVTISACNGAGNRTFSGEGLVGLSWAFLRAGAHNVIGALWEVSDSSTPQLMDKLYEGLSRGEDPASALRAAKLSLLHSDSVFRKPYYWAPFQLYAGS